MGVMPYEDTPRTRLEGVWGPTWLSYARFAHAPPLRPLGADTVDEALFSLFVVSTLIKL